MKIFRQNLIKVLSNSKWWKRYSLLSDKFSREFSFGHLQCSFDRSTRKTSPKCCNFFSQSLRKSRFCNHSPRMLKEVTTCSGKNVSSKKLSRHVGGKFVIPDENFFHRAIENVVWNPKRLKNFKHYFQKKFSWKCSFRPVEWKLDNFVEYL